MSEFSDEILAKKALENVDLFTEIIDRFEEKLRRFIARISNFSSEKIDEILQEVFIKTWKNLAEFDAKLKFSSWIYRIARNQTISEFRKSKSRGEEKQEILEIEDWNNLAANFDLTEKIDQKITGKKVRKILDLMPEKMSEILILKFLEQKSYEEISDILRIPLGTIAIRISRAKAKFLEIAQINSFFKENE